MILVLDRTASTRAEQLRDAIAQAHIPAAYSSIEKGVAYLPAVCVVTFADCAERLHRASYGDIPAVVYDTDFWIRTPWVAGEERENALLAVLRKRFADCMTSAGVLRDGNLGFYLPCGVYFTAVDAFYRNQPLRLSTREYTVLRYLCCVETAFPNTHLSAAHIWKYAFPAHRACSSNAVRAQISAINEKSTQYTGFRLIAMHRKEGGYRFAPHLPNVQKAFANGFLYRSTDSVYENEELGDVSDKTKEQGTK